MDGMEITGFEELEAFLTGVTITEADEKKAMRLAIEPIAAEVKGNTPKGFTKKLMNIKKTVTTEGFATVGTVKVGMYYGMFQEFGTSTNKRNVGFFERSVNATQDKAILILANEILKKVK